MRPRGRKPDPPPPTRAQSSPRRAVRAEPPAGRRGPRPLPAAEALATDAERRPGAEGAGRAGGRERGQGRGPAEATRRFKYGSRARARRTAWAA